MAYKSPGDIFINATEARKQLRDSVIVPNEVRALESNVLTEVNAGNLEVTVSQAQQLLTVHHITKHITISQVIPLDQISMQKVFY